MDLSRIKGICEAVIFAADKPVTTGQLVELFDDEDQVSRADVEQALGELGAGLADEGRGLALREIAGGYAFRTKPAIAPWIARLTAPKAARLSRASMETLAIVAYRQPVTRAGIDDIRGVDSGAVLKGLLEKRLIKILGRQEAVGNPLLYGTTREFLEAFSLKDLTELPTLKEFQELDDDSRRTLDRNGIVLDEPPPAAALAAASEAAGIERTGQRVEGIDDGEESRPALFAGAADGGLDVGEDVAADE